MILNTRQNENLPTPLQKGCEALLADQSPEGYWCYTLEANESIGAGFIQLMHYLGSIDPEIEKGLVNRILSEQRGDGSWALFYDGPPNLSITVECYFALRLAGFLPDNPALQKARDLILKMGGIESARVFTQIHLALFGLVPWSACPAMPLWFVLLPCWSGISIYEFSSWARQSVVPLLILMNQKKVVPVAFNLDELRGGKAEKKVRGIFWFLDTILKTLDKLPWHPGKQRVIRVAEQWIREHLERTEDIYPAMAYGVMAIKALGYPLEDPTIQKGLEGLRRFRQKSDNSIHQQCCISPLWDTPWATLALIESGMKPDSPELLRAARYLLSNQITDFRGDWRHKNRNGIPGGWAFEFQNDYFPDIDDTIQILTFLMKVDLPWSEKGEAIQRGLNWLLSMQSKNGGWAAFDKNNLSNWVNKIPFSDHGACLDPPTPDITARALQLLTLFHFNQQDRVVRPALEFLKKSQEADGSWRGRWGVNFIYGTWCVLEGLTALGIDSKNPAIQKGIHFLLSTQNPDGGWGESCLSDRENKFVPLDLSIPSQTAWAVMGLVAAGVGDSKAVRNGIRFLEESPGVDGRWEERHFTGTGFPGHFYIRYHGYRHYFPVLALSARS